MSIGEIIAAGSCLGLVTVLLGIVIFHRAGSKLLRRNESDRDRQERWLSDG